MQLDGRIIEAGTKIVLSDKVMSKGKSSNTVISRQQFCCDEMTGTIRIMLRHYCLDVDQSTSFISTAAYCLKVIHASCVLLLNVLTVTKTSRFPTDVYML